MSRGGSVTQQGSAAQQAHLPDGSVTEQGSAVEQAHLPGPPIEGRASNTSGKPGVFGFSSLKDIPAVEGENVDGGLAGLFQGDVEITGNVEFQGDVEITGNVECHGDIRLPNADCAEEFDVADGLLVEPGTVMVLDDHGRVRASQSAYDKRVAGVVSGAGDYRPALTLDSRQTSRGRLPVALIGKVYCRVDATQTPIQVGDLLTTSTTEGRAMKASDPDRAFGTVIGKALSPLGSGFGLIPILVALQ